jgi:hypothetical protein
MAPILSVRELAREAIKSRAVHAGYTRGDLSFAEG